MATIVNRPNGHKWVQLKVAGKRRTIRLGKATTSQAEAFCRHVELLAAALAYGQIPDPRITQWVNDLDRAMYRKLAAAGLAEQTAVPTSLNALIVSHAASLDVKASSRSTFDNTTRNLRDYFGASRDFRKISAGQAKDFRVWLTKSGRYRGNTQLPLSAATVSRRCRRARQIFTYAVEHGWIAKNPFAGMRGWTESNRERDHYVSRETIAKLIEHAEPEMQLLLALTRFAGVRCPSEAIPFEWTWVRWEDATLRVRSPKTDRYPNGAFRTVPIFAELQSHLQEAWQRATEQPLLFPSLQLSNFALSKRLAAICEKAGVTPWRKPWNNIRASCETDWIAEHADIFKVAAWMGHSPQVALAHYSRVAKEQATSAIAKASGGEAKPEATAGYRRLPRN